MDKDIIAERLKEDVAEMKGKVYKHIANSLALRSAHKPIFHKYPVTSVCLHGANLYTGCKDGVVEKWNLSDLRKPQRTSHIARVKDKKVFTGHTRDVLCLTISSDGTRLASGGSEKRICVWDTATMTHLKTFTQHRGPIMVTLSSTLLMLGPCMSSINKSDLLHECRSNPQIMVTK